MKGLLARLLQRTSAVPVDATAMPDGPAAGQIYSFRTMPYSEFSPPTTGRYAAFKILGVTKDHVVVAVLDGIWSAPPAGKEVRASSILEEHRASHDGRPAVFGENRQGWQPESDLEELKFVSTQSLGSYEKAFVDAFARHAIGTRFSTIRATNYAAEGEWRWTNERESFVKEMALRDAKNKAERAAQEERYRTRLSKLTWEQLLSETLFERWSPSPPFPPEDFTRAARDVVRDACIELRDLGPKPTRAAVRAVLKNTVQWFNEADEAAGGVIETEEREDILALLEEMAFVARQKVLVEEMDEWRQW